MLDAISLWISWATDWVCVGLAPAAAVLALRMSKPHAIWLISHTDFRRWLRVISALAAIFWLGELHRVSVHYGDSSLPNSPVVDAVWGLISLLFVLAVLYLLSVAERGEPNE